MSNDNNKRKAPRKSHVTRLLYVKVSLSVRFHSRNLIYLFWLPRQDSVRRDHLTWTGFWRHRGLMNGRRWLGNALCEMMDAMTSFPRLLVHWRGVPRVNLIATQSLVALRSFNRHHHVNNKLQPAWSSSIVENVSCTGENYSSPWIAVDCRLFDTS